MTMHLLSRKWAGLAMLATAFLASGCSVQRFAANKIGDTLAASGTTYSATRIRS